MKFIINLFVVTVSLLFLSFISVPQTFASSGSITIPSHVEHGQYAGLLWLPSQYLANPHIDPINYSTCNSGGHLLTGVLYNNTDDSVVASGLSSNVGCNGWMIIQYGNFDANFQNNTPYYFVISDATTGQKWKTPCFKDIGNDDQLVGCDGNVPPSLAQPDATIHEGENYTYTGSFTDPDSSSWNATVDYGDGSGIQTLPLNGLNFTLNHQYNTQGNYVLTVSVTDNQGLSGGSTGLIQVGGTGTITIPSHVEHGQYAGLEWLANQYTTSPTLYPILYTSCYFAGRSVTGTLYNYNDNTIAATGLTSNIGCAGWMIIQYGNFEANFQNNTPYYFVITDPATGQTWKTPCFEDTGNDDQLVGCTANNAPILQTISNSTVDIGSLYSTTGSFTDADSTSWTATVDYGDGTGVQMLPLSGTTYLLSHIYTTVGTYTETVHVTDNGGQTGTVTATITVNNPIVNIGYISQGDQMDTSNTNFMNGTKFVVGPVGGTVQNMSVYVGSVDISPNNHYQMAIYTNKSNGKPGNLIAQTITGNLVANSWNTLPINATFNANTTYWLMYNTNATQSNLNDMYYTTDEPNIGVYAPNTFGNWVSTYPSTPNMTTQKFSIYASYIPDGPVPQVLAGDNSIESNQDSNAAGSAEAFQFTALNSGTGTKINVYLSGANQATNVRVGIYNDTNNTPGTLLSQALINTPVNFTWNTAIIPNTTINAGTKYWVAILSPKGKGKLFFKDKSAGGQASVSSSQTNLTTLPTTWISGSSWATTSLSAFVY